MMTMERPGLWAGGFRAWNDESSYLATGPGASAGTMFRVPVGRAREAGAGVVPVRRAPDRRVLPDRPQHGLAVASTRGAHRARHTRRAVSPTSSTTRPSAAARARRRARRRAPTPVARPLRRLAEQSLTAEQFVAIDALRREIDAVAGEHRSARDRRPRGGADRLARGARRRQRVADRAGAGRGRGRRRLVRASRRRARRRHARARPRVGRGHPHDRRAALGDEGVDGAHLGARRRREVVLAARPGVATGRSTSPKGSRARW